MFTNVPSHSESTLTLAFAPLYSLITAITKSYGILIPTLPTITFLGALS